MSKKTGLRTLSHSEMVQMMATPGWRLTGGGCPESWELPKQKGGYVISTFYLRDTSQIDFKVTKTENFRDGDLEFHLDSDYTITSPEPHIIHINKIFPQKQAGWGGQERLVPQLGVWLKFFSSYLLENEKKEKEKLEAEQEAREIEAQRRKVEGLNAVGKQIMDIRLGSFATKIILIDGTVLRILSGDITSIPPRS